MKNYPALIVSVSILAVVSYTVGAADTKPHLIFIVADDLVSIKMYTKMANRVYENENIQCSMTIYIAHSIHYSIYD